MKPRLVSFDAAGTLIRVNWQPGPFAVACASECGIDLDAQVAREKYERLLHTRWREYCAINQTRDADRCDEFWVQLTRDWLEQLAVDAGLTDQITRVARERLYGADQNLFTLFADVLPTLDAIDEMGLPMVVLSNWDYSLHRILRNLGITERFTHVFASLEHGPEKPERELFDIVARTTGVALPDILHVGDHPVDDLEGARSAGMHALLLDRARTFQPPVVSSLLDVPKVLQCSV